LLATVITAKDVEYFTVIGDNGRGVLGRTEDVR